MSRVSSLRAVDDDELPRIVFCTTCKGRLAHVRQTLPQNLADNGDYPRLRTVLLDYDSNDGLGEWVAREMAGALASGRLVYWRSDDHPTFRMAHAKNLAHRLALLEGAEILVNVDADNFVGRGFARFIANRFAAARRDGEAIFLRPRENHFGPGPGATTRMPWGCGGRLALTREAFLQAGGYDETFDRWGPDDKDMTVRLERLGYVRHGIASELLRSINHGDGVRFANYDGGPRNIWDAAQQFRLEGREAVTIANFGRIGLGQARRNFDRDEMVIAPIPTRIFGIGLHKTATTSLARALERLGYDSAHWVSPTWAHTILEQFRQVGRSQVLESHYALSDLPIGILWRELDQVYPGAKFVLTVRDELDWLRSVRAHFDRFAGEWNEEGFSHYVHRELYGVTRFDALVMLERYRRHNADVRAHFADRPGDLLVMDMTRGDGWAELCGFLQMPVPAAPYPRAFVTPEPALGLAAS